MTIVYKTQENCSILFQQNFPEMSCTEQSSTSSVDKMLYQMALQTGHTVQNPWLHRDTIHGIRKPMTIL